jgi:hypothetical protein
MYFFQDGDLLKKKKRKPISTVRDQCLTFVPSQPPYIFSLVPAFKGSDQ